MPRAIGRRQQEALRQIVQNGPNLRSTVATAQRNANATGNNVVRELQNLAARGNANAQTAISLMRQGGASVSGGGGGGGAGSSGG